VIPKWIDAAIKGEEVVINGDGETSRDFTYIENVVQMNILAAAAPKEARNQIYNTAVGDRTTLNALFALIKENLVPHGANPAHAPRYKEFRKGDVRHSLADISKARTLLGYEPSHSLSAGLKTSIEWYVACFESTLD
jgi:UDP-N-acetylglucosamine 4-epimerase